MEYIVYLILHALSWLAGRPYAIIHDPWFEIPYTLGILTVPTLLIVYFVRRKHKKKIVSNPNKSCSFCGTLNGITYNFCGSCGTQLRR